MALTTLPDKPWFPVTEAAALIGVHHSTIYRWMQCGQVEYSGIPYFWRVSRESLVKKFSQSSHPSR